MAEIKQVKLVVYLGATLEVDGRNWAKPSVQAEVVFDGLPTEEQAKKGWDYLFEKQVLPQAQDIFDVMMERQKLLPNTPNEAPATRRPRRVASGTPVPEGESYQ